VSARWHEPLFFNCMRRDNRWVLSEIDCQLHQTWPITLHLMLTQRAITVCLVYRLPAVIDWASFSMLCTQFTSMLTRAHICCITSFEFLLFQTFSDIYVCRSTVWKMLPKPNHPIFCLCTVLACCPIVCHPPPKNWPNWFFANVQTSLNRAVLGARSNSSSDASEHSEESDIRSLTDSEQYLTCSESTTPITPSTL